MEAGDLRRLISAVEDANPRASRMLRPAWSGRLQRGNLRQPAWPEGVIRRSRLLARIDEGDPLLTLIVASAGFGKTLAAVEWAQQEPPAAWLTVDAFDTSLHCFWAHLHAALEDVAPGIGEIVTAAMRMPARVPAIEIGRMFADELLDVPTQVRLVIDDLHLVATSEVYEFLSGLLEAMPPTLRLVITTRIDPPLPLARLRLRGALGEVRVPDLLFTPAETQRLVGLALPADADAAQAFARTLWQRTRGWPAGVRLGALALARSADSPETVLADAHQAGQRLIADLLEEVLAERSPDEQHVILRAALPDAFTPDLATALLDVRPDESSAAVSAALRFALAADLCRTTVDRGEEWLTYHPLFRDALRSQLERQESPETLRSLHARAAAWCESAGRTGIAISHWIAAGVVDAAVALVEGEASGAFDREDWPTVARWLALLPDHEVEDRLELLLASAWVAQLRGQALLLRDWLSRINASLAERNLPDEERTAVRAEVELLSLVLLVPLQIDPEGALTGAQHAIARIPATRRYQQGIAQGVFGAALQALGRGAEAVEVLTAWSETARIPGDSESIRALLALLFVHAQAGSLDRVESVGSFMRDLAERHRLRLSLGWAHRFLGEVGYERNDLTGALAHFGAVAHDNNYGHLVAVREAFFGLARASLAQGQPGEAARALRRCREVVVDAGAVEHLPAIDASEAYLALRAGDVDRALAWANANQPAIDEASLHVVGHPAVIRAAILAAGSEADRAEALSLLAELRARAMHAHFVNLLVRLDALMAVTLMRHGETDAATTAMRRSLETGAQQGFTRTYLDLMPTFTPELAVLAAHLDFPAAVRAALVSSATKQGVAAAPLLHSPLAFLTRREAEVLTAFSQRLSYREIADQLFISPYTVKRHAASIYSKLGVSGRAEAIRVANEMGWRS